MVRKVINPPLFQGCYPDVTRMSRFSKRAKSTKSKKSLTILVSFEPFWHSEVSHWKVCRPLCTSRMANSETVKSSMPCTPVYEPYCSHSGLKLGIWRRTNVPPNSETGDRSTAQGPGEAHNGNKPGIKDRRVEQSANSETGKGAGYGP